MEIEAKYRLRPGQRERLLDLLPPGKTLRQEDRYFDVPDKVLRIRQENDDFLLTQKGEASFSAEGVKSREEEENPLSTAEVALLERLLPWMGHRELMTVSKTRTVFQREGALLCLDRVEGLGDFLEIEANPGQGAEAVRRAAAWLADAIGLAPEQIQRASYAKLLADQEKKALGKSLEQ